ncbi:MAG: hypothetical protein ACJ780_09655 [Solirubrobacteraceae bacterium]
MVSSLITLPFRVARGGVKLAVRSTREAIDLAGGVVGAVLERTLGGSGDDGGPEMTPETQMPPDTRAPAPRPATAPEAARAPGPEPPPITRRLETDTDDDESIPSLAEEPVHVSEEPVLVEEFAEPGAEDGAGAQLRVAEPWEGYREMKASDIIERLESASREELAAIELYELAGRNRASVVSAAHQALKRASPPR